MFSAFARRKPARAAVKYRVGIRVPETARLYSVPQPAIAEVPAIRWNKVMVVNNRAVPVDPATSEVAAELGN